MGATSAAPEANKAKVVSILAHLEGWALLQCNRHTRMLASFQSSPTSKGGRYLGEQSDSVIRTLFQSSPTSKGGRYLPARPEMDLKGMFQSSPTSKGGRYVTSTQFHTLQQLFQSSPTSKGGRYEEEPLMPWVTNRFNPRPPRRVGATTPTVLLVDEYHVSILAHLEGWALRRRDCSCRAPLMFQSSPTSKGGRYASAASQTAAETAVSILAHLEGWALPVTVTPTVA